MTSAALVTFPGATLAARVILAVLGQISPEVGSSTITALVVSFIVGGVIYLIGYKGGATVQERAINVLIAIINCFFIAAGVLGVDELVAGSDNASASP
jgi:hypothetical protein